MEKAVINQGDLQKKVLSLDHPWRFHPGNDSTWSQKQLTDSSWLRTRPTISSFNKAQSQKTASGWFRYHFYIDSALRGRTVAFIMDQYGASSIYLNGKLIKKFGHPGNTDQTELFHHPVQKLFYGTLDQESEQVIAVHYSASQLPRLPSGFQLSITSPEKAAEQLLANTQNKALIELTRLGIFSAFALFHLISTLLL